MPAAIDCQIAGCRWGDPMVGCCDCQPLTEQDVDMIRRALEVGVDDIDYSAFYEDGDD